MLLVVSWWCLVVLEWLDCGFISIVADFFSWYSWCFRCLCASSIHVWECPLATGSLLFKGSPSKIIIMSFGQFFVFSGHFVKP